MNPPHFLIISSIVVLSLRVLQRCTNYYISDSNLPPLPQNPFSSTRYKPEDLIERCELGYSAQLKEEGHASFTDGAYVIPPPSAEASIGVAMLDFKRSSPFTPR